MSCPPGTPADPGELREEFAEICTRALLMPSMYDRAVRVIRKLARATGLTEQDHRHRETGRRVPAARARAGRLRELDLSRGSS
jgi:hypothetical protein